MKKVSHLEGGRMEEYALVTEEMEETGIQGRVYRLNGPSRLLFEEHLFMAVLRGGISYGYEGRQGTLHPGGLLFVQERKPLYLSSEDGWLLCCFIPAACLGSFSGTIRCCSGDQPDQTAYMPLRELLSEIIMAQAQSGSRISLLLQSLWKRFLYLLLSVFGEEGIQSAGSTEPRGRRDHASAFQDILAVLNQTYMEQIRLGDLAERFYYTPSHLSRMFRQYAGMGFLEYLTQLRLQKALSLLRQPGLEIQQIAEKTGFPNARAFSNAFQEKFTLTPSAYRRQLFRKNPSVSSAQALGSTVGKLRAMGLFEALFAQSPKNHAHISERESLQRVIGPLSLSSSGIPSDFSKKNSILNVSRMRDLLLDSVQEQIATLQKEIGYTYLSCHGFLADDMQIYRRDLVTGKQEIQFGFLLYEKALGFVRSQGLKMIFYLGNTPSFLAASSAQENLLDGGRLALPRSMEAWKAYIRSLFSFLAQTFGCWLADCPVMPCPDLEIALALQKEDSSAWFQFYLETMDAVRSVLPEVRMISPRISCTRTGFQFAKQYLRFCGEHGISLEWLNICFVEQAEAVQSDWMVPMELKHFTEELRNQSRLSGMPPDIPIYLLEYYYSFQLNPICDSAAGAMFPLRVTLEYPSEVQSLGYWFVSDCTTEDAYGYRQFLGNRGLFTLEGIRKASYYALYFLSRLGKECLFREKGCVVTRSGKDILLLLYWDVPKKDWAAPLSLERVSDFYAQFPDKQFTVCLTDVPGDRVMVIEQSVSYVEGSAFEEWAKGGGVLLDQVRKGLIFPIVSPRCWATEYSCGKEFTYSAKLLPFEMRFVTLRFPLSASPYTGNQLQKL